MCEPRVRSPGFAATDCTRSCGNSCKRSKRPDALRLSPEQPTPSGWGIRNTLHLIGIPLLVLILRCPLLIVIAPFYLILPAPVWRRPIRKLCRAWIRPTPMIFAQFEDRIRHQSIQRHGKLEAGTRSADDASSVFSAPSITPRGISSGAAGWGAFARSISPAGCSSMAGSGWFFSATTTAGSRVTWTTSSTRPASVSMPFSATASAIRAPIGWCSDGCQDERKYKNYLRRHTLPTQVWYKAYPGLTAIDLERNTPHPRGH